MKKNIERLFVAGSASALFLLAGCTKSSDVSADTLKELQREVMQLKADNANLMAKNGALDDKILIFEKQKESNDGAELKEKLKTVKLSPSMRDNELDDYENSTISDEISFATQAELKKINAEKIKDEKRPILMLSGEYSSIYDGNSEKEYSNTSKPLGSSDESKYKNVVATGRGDNLGVVNGSDPDLSSVETSQSAMDVFNSAYRAYGNGNYSAAISGFNQFIKMAPSDSFADNALFWKGESYLAKGDTIKAITEYERVLRRFPNSEKAPSCMYRIGYIYEQLNDMQKAGSYYFKVVETYPGTEAAKKASKRMAGQVKTGALVKTSLKR
ncbi:MAG: tol-pal system protein YbgF [Deltaproteobacteria bacterium]|nr:tol-pal system protein YbgF [Deltaproteobacteria bacterium]